MKKVLYILLCIFVLAGCNSFTLRKDKSERVTFNKSIPQGDYNIYLYDIKYPSSQEDKIIFFSKFENFLKNGVSEKDNNINFIISKELYSDIMGVINEEGIGIEKSFFKSASFIDENDKKIINMETKYVKTPSNGGEIQSYLNKQYYYILTLFGREKEYDKNFFYTEYDKRKLTSEFLKERDELKKILTEKKRNFVVKVDNINETENYKNEIIYIKNSDENLIKELVSENIKTTSPIVIVDSEMYDGYTSNNKNVILFNGDGENRLSFFRRYNFNTIIKDIDNFSYSNFNTDEKQIKISVLLDRKKYVPKRPLTE